MAFVAGAVVVRSSATGAFVSKAPVMAARRAARPAAMSMKVPAPSSEVLGLGKNVPAGLYLILSVLSLGLGSYAVAQQNLFTPLTPNGINPQFVVGSLLVPISWGLHVAGWIQMQNKK
uniref:Uncharacterized protein n=1 Tax=Erythrolobus australicus TaxID=1077150 RepID=A0A7S1TKR9_9RHOD|mmetsp:Transcript_3059/g.8454  ORF Transcript_3059/g.8454 Transcript_3059/m.8454 type:complete len:118 (+) Transcript_3059:81-434(+)|eukprot:CAMPEP_0185831748 /NCGR_PEP_ID=MMETSP1353-20130828/1684_1 /TAXON_ID=1077150 /ORGANISM="Erythrolobus australicus, Strain CCMP3124" /LENGTH=117 /DNA_ID=CAMNT_0028529855 /DNA_START=72 /DNA_END=425 /DNA_ORIENTATION=-